MRSDEHLTHHRFSSSLVESLVINDFVSVLCTWALCWAMWSLCSGKLSSREVDFISYVRYHVGVCLARERV